MNFPRKRGGGNNELEEPEPFVEMSSIFRLVTLYESLLHNQWQYVKEFCRLKKTELRRGMWFGYLFELARFMCVIVLLIYLFTIRLGIMNSLTTFSNKGWIFYANYLITFWIVITIFLLVSIFFQIGCFQTQTPKIIVFSAALNFILSILVISLIVPLLIYQSDSENFMKETFRRNFAKKGQFNSIYFGVLESQQQCCGIQEPEDYFKEILFSYNDPMSGQSIVVDNRLDWMEDQQWGLYYSIPPSCCKLNSFLSRNCSTILVTKDDVAEIKTIIEHENYGALRKFQKMPEERERQTVGCMETLDESAGILVTNMLWCLLVLIILTAAVFTFIIILLLYHDGVGHIVSSSKIFDVNRNTGVHFMLCLDKYHDNGFPDDFSLIEFLRKTDIDVYLQDEQPSSPKKRRRKH